MGDAQDRAVEAAAAGRLNAGHIRDMALEAARGLPCAHCGCPKSAARHNGEAITAREHKYMAMTESQRLNLLALQRKAKP
jgi:hypothetical protein